MTKLVKDRVMHVLSYKIFQSSKAKRRVQSCWKITDVISKAKLRTNKYKLKIYYLICKNFYLQKIEKKKKAKTKKEIAK